MSCEEVFHKYREFLSEFKGWEYRPNEDEISILAFKYHQEDPQRSPEENWTMAEEYLTEWQYFKSMYEFIFEE